MNGYAVIEGDASGKITKTELYNVEINKHILENKGFEWKLDKTLATYNPDDEKYTTEKYLTKDLPLDAETVKYKNKDAWIIQTESGVFLWAGGKEETLFDNTNYNLRVRPVKNTKAKKVLDSG